MIQTQYSSARILIVDDEKIHLNYLSRTLEICGFENVCGIQDPREAMQKIQDYNPSVVFLDLNMPHISGLELLEAISRRWPEIQVLVVTAEKNVELAVQCMKSGALDLIVKPAEEGRLESCIFAALEKQKLILENQALKKLIENQDKFENPLDYLCTKNQKMLRNLAYLKAIGNSSSPVMIIGETGTGKELMAKAVHDLSSRCRSNLVTTNIAGVDEHIFSDTLFGHVRHAFTGADRQRNGLLEEARGGSLFLDEIGDLPQNLQVALLRLIDSGEYRQLGEDKVKYSNARLIFATNHNLPKQISLGRFREDLYHRISFHKIEIPPLRERREDIAPLINYFAGEAAVKYQKKVPEISTELLHLFGKYGFPGNIRELKNLVVDGLLQTDFRGFPLEYYRQVMNLVASDFNGFHKSTEDIFRECEILPTIREATESLIQEAMQRSSRNQSRAARVLGITQQALSKRLKS